MDYLEPLLNEGSDDPELIADDLHIELGFCGCGDPEAALLLMRDLLRAIHDHRERRFTEVDAYFDELEDVIHWRSESGLAHIVLYHLDHLELTEHGGSVPGWLTPKGERALALLDK